MKKPYSRLTALILCFSILFEYNINAENVLQTQQHTLAPQSAFKDVAAQSPSMEELHKNPDFVAVCQILRETKGEPPEKLKQIALEFFKNQGRRPPVEIDFDSVILFQDTIYFIIKTLPEEEKVFVASFNPEDPPDLKHLKVMSKNIQAGVAIISGDSVEPFLLSHYRHLSLQEKPFKQWLKRFDIPKSELEFFVHMDEIKENPILSLQNRKQLEGIATKEEKKTFRSFAIVYTICAALFILIVPNLSSLTMAILFSNAMIVLPVLSFLWLKFFYGEKTKREKTLFKWNWRFWKNKTFNLLGKIFSVSVLAYIITKLSTVFHELGHWILGGLAPWVTSRQIVILWENLLLGVGTLAYVTSRLDLTLFDPTNPLHRLLFIATTIGGSFFELILGLTMVFSGFRLRNKLPGISSLLVAFSLPIFLSAFQYPLGVSAALSNLQIPDPSNDWFNFVRFARPHLWNAISFFFYVPILFLGYLTYQKSIKVWLSVRFRNWATRTKERFHPERVANYFRRFLSRHRFMNLEWLENEDFRKLNKNPKFLKNIERMIRAPHAFRYFALTLTLMKKDRRHEFIRNVTKWMNKRDANLLLLRLMAFQTLSRDEGKYLIQHLEISQEELLPTIETLAKTFPNEALLTGVFLEAYLRNKRDTKDKVRIKAQQTLQFLRSVQPTSQEKLPSSIKGIAGSTQEMSEKIRAWFPDRLTADFIVGENHYFALTTPLGSSQKYEYYIFNPQSGLKKLRIDSEMTSFKELAKNYFLKVSHFNAGGTIDMKGETGRRGLNAVKEIIGESERLLASSRNLFKYGLDSSTIGPEEYRIIIEAISEEIHRKRQLAKFLDENPHLAGGIVINHGTDTLAETALIVSNLFNGKTPFPIVFTGGLLPPSLSGSDARGNLKKAVELAMTSMMPPLVYGVFIDKVFLGDRMFKSALFLPEDESSNYFEAYELSVGKFIGGELVLNDDFMRWWEKNRKFFSKTSKRRGPDKRLLYHPDNASFAYVDHVVITPYTSPEVIFDAIESAKKHVREGAPFAGIVIEGLLQKSRYKKEIMEIISTVAKDSILIFTEDTQASKHIMKIPKGLPTWQARTLLSLTLGTHFKNKMSFKNVRKQLNRLFKIVLNHQKFKKRETDPIINNADAFFPKMAEFIRAFPGMDAQGIHDAIARAERGKKTLLFIEGFGDGHLPIGAQPMGLRMKEYLSSLKAGKMPDEVKLIERLETTIRPEVSLSTVLNETQRYFEKLNENQIQAFETEKGSRAAQNVVRRAMSASHPILAALDEASKKEIQVILLSNVPRGRPNLTLYEIGNMVKFMGALDLSGMDRMDGRFPLFGAQDWKDFLTQARKPRLVILGPPGSGKKTQGKFLAKNFGIPYISTGEILKMVAQEDSELGRMVKKGLRENKPLVNAFMVSLIRERLMQPDAKDGFILEGFPRTIQQAEALDQIFSELGIKLDTVISLEVHERIAALRLLNKGRLEGKSKEIQAAVESRLFRFKGESLPLREYYQNRLLLTQIDEVQETFDIQDNIKRNQKRILQKVKDLLYAQNVSNPTPESVPNSEYFEMAA